jgi:hypothetical protein
MTNREPEIPGSVLTADAQVGLETAVLLCVVPNPDSRFPCVRDEFRVRFKDQEPPLLVRPSSSGCVSRLIRCGAYIPWGRAPSFPEAPISIVDSLRAVHKSIAPCL